MAAATRAREIATTTVKKTGTLAGKTAIKAASGGGSTVSLSSAPGIILAAGAVTLANEAVFAPVASGGKISSNFNWRVIPATAGLALAMSGLEKLAPKFAVGLSYLVLAAVFIVKTGNANTPIDNITKALGYKS